MDVKGCLDMPPYNDEVIIRFEGELVTEGDVTTLLEIEYVKKFLNYPINSMKSHIVLISHRRIIPLLEINCYEGEE